MPTVSDIALALKSIYSKDTCYHGDVEKWTDANPTTGHCAVVALIIQEFFGWEVCKTTVNRASHYFNILSDGTIIDLTAEQFAPIVPSYKKYSIANRNNMLKNKDTKERYLLLKERLFNTGITTQKEDIYGT